MEIVKLEAPELQGLEKSKADQIKLTFEPMAKMLSDFESQVNEVIETSKTGITKELTAKAKRIRLDIGKVRIETGKLKDKQKEYIKLEDRAIMGVHNILVWAVKEKEDQLKEIEDYFEIQERKRLDSLQSERAEMLSKFVNDAFERNLSGMDEDVWNAYFQIKKKEHEDRIEAEKQAELDRIQKEKELDAERERIRLENERLKKEAEEREKADKIRIAKEEAERKANEAKLKAEREEYERILLAERKSAAEKLEKEMEEARRLAQQLKAKDDAEKAEKLKIEQESEEKRKAQELDKKAPEKEKIIKVIDSLQMPELELKEYNKTYSDILTKFNSFKSWASNQLK